MVCCCTQAWTGNPATNNYVLYQNPLPSDTVSRLFNGTANVCAVVSTSHTYASSYVSLMSVSPFCRVNHFGSQNDDPIAAWGDNSWQSYSSSSPNYADEGINLMYQFPTLGPGASAYIYFYYSYNLATTNMNADMGKTTILQPTDVASGTACQYTLLTYGNYPYVVFFLMRDTTLSLQLGNVSTYTATSDGARIYTLYFDSTVYANNDADAVGMFSPPCCHLRALF